MKDNYEVVKKSVIEKIEKQNVNLDKIKNELIEFQKYEYLAMLRDVEKLLTELKFKMLNE